jgi:hypothetical protein
LAIEQIRKSRIHTPLGSEVEINPRIVHDPEIGKIIKQPIHDLMDYYLKK